MSRITKILLSLLGVGILFFLTWYPLHIRLFEKSAIQNTNTIQEVTVGYLPMVSSLSYFVATENNYFVDEGLIIKSRTIPKSDEIATDLINGNIDIAIELSITPLLKYAEKIQPEKIPFKIFSVSKITNEQAFDGVLVRSDSNYKNLADLSSKRVAVFPGSTSLNVFSSVFKKNFKDTPIPSFVSDIPLPQQLIALSNKEVEAVHAYEPALTIGMLKFKFRKLFGSIYAEQISPNPIGVAAINKKYAENNPDTTIKIIRALDRASIYIREHPEQSRNILEKYTKAEKNIALNMNVMPMTAHSEIDINNLDNYLKILQTIGENKTFLTAKQLILESK